MVCKWVKQVGNIGHPIASHHWEESVSDVFFACWFASVA